MSRQKKIYLTNEQLADALIESQQAGMPTEKICNYFRMIAKHLLGNPRYRNYSKDMQEDMTSAALVKCIKNIHNFKPEYANKCFNYYTRTTECAFFEVLGLHYKQKNIKRDLCFEYADSIEAFNPCLAKTIRDYNKE